MKKSYLCSSRSHEEISVSQESVEVNADSVLPLHAQDALRLHGDHAYGNNRSSSGLHRSSSGTSLGMNGAPPTDIGYISSSSSDNDTGPKEDSELGGRADDSITTDDNAVDDDNNDDKINQSHHSLPSPEEVSGRNGRSIALGAENVGGEGVEAGEFEQEYNAQKLRYYRRRSLMMFGGLFLLLVIVATIVAIVVTQGNDKDGRDNDGENSVVLNPDDPNKFQPTAAPVGPPGGTNDDNTQTTDDDFPYLPKPGDSATSEPVDLTNYCPLNLEMRGVTITDFNQSIVLPGKTDNTTLIGVNNNPNATGPEHALPLCHEDDEDMKAYGRGLWYTMKGPGAVVRATTCSGAGLLFGGSTGGLAGPPLDTQLTVFSSATSNCGQLECVTHNDDSSCGAPTEGQQSVVSWYAEKGRLYYIYVTGKPVSTADGATADIGNTDPTIVERAPEDDLMYPVGTFMLTLSLAPLGTCDAAIDYETVAVSASRVVLDPVQQAEVTHPSSLVVDTLLGANFGLDPCVPGEYLGRGGETWYKVVGNGRFLSASTCSSTSANEFPPRLALYHGNCDQLDCALAKASNSTPSVDRDCGFGYSVNWWSQTGVVYYIMVYKTTFLPGVQFGLTVEDLDPPSNDNCTGATRLFADGTVTYGSTLRATHTSDQLAPTCVEDGVVHTHPGIWYRVVGTGTRLTASLCHEVTKYDTKISVYEGSCGNLRCVIGNDQWCGYQSSVDWESVSGTMYYILVHGSTGGTSPSMGDFGLTVFEFKPSVNDFCSGAITVETESVIQGSTTTASADEDVDSCDRTGAILSNQSPGVWYRVVGTGTGMRASTCGSETEFDTRISIYFGEDCEQLKCLISDDNGCGFQSSAYWHSNEGEIYYILVNGNRFSSFGDFVLRIDEYHTNTINDFCANAITASTSTVNLGSTKNATFDGVETCVVTNTAPGIWYKVIGSGTGMVATTCHIVTDFDTRISVFRGSNCEELECVAGNDDSHQSASCGSSAGSRVSWLSELGQEYRILVHGWGALVGTFGLTIEEVVPVVSNDFCITAEEVSVSVGGGNTNTVVAMGTNIDATVDNVPICGDVDAIGRGVWFRSVGTGNRLVASTCNTVDNELDNNFATVSTLTPGVVTDFDSQISVFKGGCRTLECVGANNDRCGLQSSVNFFAEQGEVFYVLVHGAGDSKGSFGLVLEEIFPQVANDFCNTATVFAIAAGGSINRVLGSTADASYDTVEECVVPNTSPGVWYRVTGSGNHITVTTCGDVTNFDTRLSIYTSLDNNCQSLQCVTGNDDTSRDTGTCGLASTATWPSIRGQIYYIRVHGWGSTVGEFELKISEQEQPPA